MSRNNLTPKVVGFCLLLSLALVAQERNPLAGDAKAAAAGEFQFRINCSFCHGLGARGGGRGPDLTLARKRHGASDVEMFHNIKEGIAGTAMPAAIGSIGVGMTDAEVWQVVTYLRSVQVKAPAHPPGSAANGKDAFFGSAKCFACHMVEGKGGRLGPDLTGTGSARSIESIIESIRNPSRRLAAGLTEATKAFPQEYETVTVVTAEGKTVTGVTLNEDSFSVQLMDPAEKIYLLEKDKLRSFKKTRVSLMPAYDISQLSDKDLGDIVAYLISVEAK
jgi:cytochrome c oxidase cbb3-type subunit III